MRMEELARQQPGFLGIIGARGEDGVGITVSYWESLEAIRCWREHPEHREAQRLGRDVWYESFDLQICEVKSQRRFDGIAASEQRG